MGRKRRYGLRKAIIAIAHYPSPMTTSGGRIVPALYYSEAIEQAIQWLVDRYNDGTLKVEGYEKNDAISRTVIKTSKMRNEEIIDAGGYMQLSKFARETGFSLPKVRRIAKKAGAYCSEGEGKAATVLINTQRFFHYIDQLAKNQDYETFVNVEEASMLTGLSKDEVWDKIRSGEFKVQDNKNDKTRSVKIYRTSLYKDPDFIPKPMIFSKELKKYKNMK